MCFFAFSLSVTGGSVMNFELTAHIDPRQVPLKPFKVLQEVPSLTKLKRIRDSVVSCGLTHFSEHPSLPVAKFDIQAT